MREVGGQIVGETVSEIVLFLVAAQVLERQHDDGETRRIGELVVNGSGHETWRIARTPSKGPRRDDRDSERRSKAQTSARQAPRSRRCTGRFFVAGAPWRNE